jgi:hypothetical protein
VRFGRAGLPIKGGEPSAMLRDVAHTHAAILA